jgi:hypothetical protein
MHSELTEEHDPLMSTNHETANEALTLLHSRIDEALAAAERWTKAVTERGNEIDAVLAKIRTVRTETRVTRRGA